MVSAQRCPSLPSSVPRIQTSIENDVNRMAVGGVFFVFFSFFSQLLQNRRALGDAEHYDGASQLVMFKVEAGQSPL